MFLKEVSIKNYRSILDETLPCDELTALVGPNGSGKTSFLRAIQLFYDPTAKVATEDFYAEDTVQDIEISLTFTSLSQEAKEHFALYVEVGDLTVVRVIPDPNSNRQATYHGIRLQNPDFNDIRSTRPALEKRNKYKKIRDTEKYACLPSATSVAAVDTALNDWEHQNPESCERMRDDGQFFGFKQVGHSYLSRYTQCIYVPAVQNAADDATESKGSIVTELMDLVVRKALTNRPEVIEFKNQVLAQYKKVMAPQKLPELNTLQDDLSKILRQFVPKADLDLHWDEPSEIPIPTPKAIVRLSEDNYTSRVETTGHGLQRALIITMLQHLYAVRRETVSREERSTNKDAAVGSELPTIPSTVLMIEEPELYQHPSRQRHFAAVLMNLATNSMSQTTGSIQIIYSTHSPLFIGLDRFNQIRALRKTVQDDNKPNVTTLKKTDISSVAMELQDAHGSTDVNFTAETLPARLQAIMTLWTNEGFFADAVVLVEGETDRATILGVAQAMGYELDGLGIAIIPCFGKNNLDRPLVIFRQLDIPVYVIWDGDWKEAETDNNPESNRKILRLLRMPEEDWPEFIGENAACFKANVETTLKNEIGTHEFEQWRYDAQEHFGIRSKRRGQKNPMVLKRIIEKAEAEGKFSTSLKNIVEKIVALRPQTELAP